MISRRETKVFQAQIEPPLQLSLGAEDDATRVRNALTPGSRVERRRTMWLIGKTEMFDDDTILVGRLGFVKDTDHSEIWDEGQKDFREIAIPRGQTTTFAVNLETLVVTVHPRGEIQTPAALNALKDLLSLEGEKWTVKPLRTAVPFEVWKSTVDRVTRVKFDLRKPNPNYADAKDLEALMESTEAQHAQLKLEAENGLELDAPFVRDSIVHVQRNYGTAEFEGQRNGQIVKYYSETGQEESVSVLSLNDGQEIDPSEMAKIANKKAVPRDEQPKPD